jgi:serine/threonine protein kinase
VDEVLAIGLGIARGLAAAHARSIIHRDLKPENTFLTLDGSVKILDFGLAKLQLPLDSLPSQTPGTMTGVILGTVGYMAPEQVKGETVDARADLFALGVMLYEMLASEHPFRSASTFETLHAVLTISPPDLLSLNARVPPALGRIAMRLLEKSRDARFQSARDVVWALEQVDTAAAPRQASRPARNSTRRLRRSRSTVWTSALAAAASVLITPWSFGHVSSRDARSPELTRFTWPLPSGIALGSAPVVSPDGRKIAFVGRSGTASQLYVRSRGAVEAVPIPGTDQAAHPFWSADDLPRVLRQGTGDEAHVDRTGIGGTTASGRNLRRA